MPAGDRCGARSTIVSALVHIPDHRGSGFGHSAEGATRTRGEIQEHTSKLGGLTSDPIWRVAEFVPKLGVNLSVVRELAAVTDDVMVEVVVPPVTVAGSVDPASFAPQDGAIDAAGAIEQSSAANLQLSGPLEGIAPTLETLNIVVPLIPPAVGSEVPRTYVLMFQNPAESRA